MKLSAFKLLKVREGRGPDAEKLRAILTDLEASGQSVWLSALLRSLGTTQRAPGVLSGYLRRFAAANGLRFRSQAYIRERADGSEVEDRKLWVVKR